MKNMGTSREACQHSSGRVIYAGAGPDVDNLCSGESALTRELAARELPYEHVSGKYPEAPHRTACLA